LTPEAEVIVTQNTPATAAMRRQTTTVPIVFALVSDPVGSGFAESLARPGGNVTGFTNLVPSLAGKWVELLKEIAPHIMRVGILSNPITAPYVTRWGHVQDNGLAANYGVKVNPPEDRPWGIRDFVVVDPTGVLWRVGQTIKDTTDVRLGSWLCETRRHSHSL
jgi:hypothetical protein